MARQITKHNTPRIMGIPEDRMNAFTRWLTNEVDDAISSRYVLESQWREDLKMYEGVPRLASRNVPIENAPNIEITLAAISVDSIYAQAIDLIFGAQPLLTVRPVPKKRADKQAENTAKAIQRFVNLISSVEANARDATEDSVLNDVQLGTGFFYIPWQERRKKTKTSQVLTVGPRIYAVPPEDIVVRSGTPHDEQQTEFIGIRFWRTKDELEESAKYDKWNISGCATAGAKDQMRYRRESLGAQISGQALRTDLYDCYDIYCHYDIDGDGIPEDLYVVWNHTGRWICKVGYNPFDCRPIVRFRYQRRAHLFYGLGVIRMMKPYEEEMTEIHNYQVLNAMLANARIWKGKHGSVPDTMLVWPGKFVPLNDPDDLKAEAMADVYPSLMSIQALILQLADNRVGTNAMSQPRPSQIMGSRTPGITALSLLQQVNRRFTPAFDGMRIGVAEAHKQCLFRYQERVLANDESVLLHINTLLGVEDGPLVIAALMDEHFDEQFVVELTAASASINREADRQNAVMLVNVLATYYQRTLELITIASNPQTPAPVREVAKKIADSAGEVIERTIRTFDQVRDPATFIIDISDQLDQTEGMNPQGLQGLMGILMGNAGAQQPLALPERTMI